MPLRSASDWIDDTELEGFVRKTLQFDPDYDGPVSATLVRSRTRPPAPKGAVLYLHGFLDYFFHAHVAAAFAARGYELYGLDLRKYGRSLPATHPNFCKDMAEYFPEMSASIDIITGEGSARVVLMAHSTGALPALLYAKGTPQSSISRIVLTSPFLDFKEHPALTRPAAVFGRVFPFVARRDPVCKWYGHSLHLNSKGTWTFNTRLKPLENGVAYLGWVNAVVEAQDRVAAGLDLSHPILVLHSDTSLDCGDWRDAFHRTDLVLDVADIKRLSPRLGRHVALREIAGAKHDVLLSERRPLDAAFEAIFEWLP